MLRLVLIFPLLGLWQCQRDESVAAYGAADRTWGLQEINGEVFAATATLTFPEPGKVAGQAPCNAYSGVLDAPYPWFEVRDIAATRKACPDLEAEGTYFAALMAMTLSEVSGEVLILRNDAGHEMVFTATE